jgi:hypothetical protein
MAQEQIVTVNMLLPDDFTNMEQTVRDEMAKDPGLTKTPGFVAGIVGEKAGAAARGLLNIDVFELIAQAWAKARELHEYADASKHPPGEVGSVFLGENDPTCNVHPVVDVRIGALGKLSLKFTLALSAHIKAAELKIQDRRIIAVGHTVGSVSAVLKYGDIPLHNELKSHEHQLCPSATLKAPGVLIL